MDTQGSVLSQKIRELFSRLAYSDQRTFTFTAEPSRVTPSPSWSHLCEQERKQFTGLEIAFAPAYRDGTSRFVYVHISPVRESSSSREGGFRDHNSSDRRTLRKMPIFLQGMQIILGFLILDVSYFQEYVPILRQREAPMQSRSRSGPLSGETPREALSKDVSNQDCAMECGETPRTSTPVAGFYDHRLASASSGNRGGSSYRRHRALRPIS